MSNLLLAIIIILVLCIVYYLSMKRSEYFTSSDETYIRLYEGFGNHNLAYEFYPDSPEAARIGNGYIKQLLRVNLKSVDINLPKVGNGLDDIRRVEIWSVGNEDIDASTESGFYNSYLEPESELRANPAKYRNILRVLPGERLKIDMALPIKKIFLIAAF
jgi:hypothetical protein